MQENRYYPYGMLQGESTDIVRLNALGYASAGGSPRKYGGKELLSANGLNMHDFEVRLQDFATCRFTTPDPRQWEYPYFSQYLYCAANPISFVDMLGLEPTPTEAARMSDFVYGDSEVELIGRWTPSNIIDFNVDDDDSGLKCMLFQREIGDGQMEYTLAFAGTELNNGFVEFFKDAKSDILQTRGLSAQYSRTIGLAKGLKELFRDNKLFTFTGHSLGGGLAAASAFATGGRAITFNAAGVSWLTKMPNIKARIDAYITINDPLDYIQRLLSTIPRANGVIHKVIPKTINPHGIKNFY